MGITVFGSLNYDLVTYTDRMPLAGETIRANSFETHAGGKGLNQTIALARLKNTVDDYVVRMIGCVGQDSFGEQLLDLLKESKVDVSAVRQIENESTGTATILVEEQTGGQNRILLTEGANGRSTYTPAELDVIFNSSKKEDSRGKSDYVVLQHEIPDPGSIILWVKENCPAHEIVFNPSPFHLLGAHIWASVDILVVNELEALQILESLYTREDYERFHGEIEIDFVQGYTKICQEFQKNLVYQSNSATVMITLGVRGAVFSSNAEKTVKYFPASRGIKVVDTTGAGDTFLGALITQLYRGNSLWEAVKISTIASSLAIQKKGAAESIPSYAELCNYLKQAPCLSIGKLNTA
ncbi:hypothetical protein HG535_0A01550 [Zygotorulaspora mrakii]|uniref:Ribokinase n=1 Tax=Zygotorulaspora mrakii TaxID=42260 RepID=A0A7H9AVN2_ZYGMR|nr:uncharacterized protein HG535_0A01550 [Zygotorulaspora mrakii]QLG70217.1 hypothetical protein HG535_0A01550 [Zygotorulaspora mrakii]